MVAVHHTLILHDNIGLVYKSKRCQFESHYPLYYCIAFTRPSLSCLLAFYTIPIFTIFYLLWLWCWLLNMLCVIQTSVHIVALTICEWHWHMWSHYNVLPGANFFYSKQHCLQTSKYPQSPGICVPTNFHVHSSFRFWVFYLEEEVMMNKTPCHCPISLSTVVLSIIIGMGMVPSIIDVWGYDSEFCSSSSSSTSITQTPKGIKPWNFVGMNIRHTFCL